MDDLPDAGFIEGLPVGWVDCKVAAIRFWGCLEDRLAGCDPAPWHQPENAEDSANTFGHDVGPYILKEKMNERVASAFQRDILNGLLRPSIFDGNTLIEIPRCAFMSAYTVRASLTLGRLSVDPLWPDEWWRCNGRSWAIPKVQFDAWLASDAAFAADGLPPSAAIPENELIATIQAREPSRHPRVSLSEAISWIAFGIALDADRLERALHLGGLAGGDLQQAQRDMEQAVENLLRAGSDQRVAFFGRYLESRQSNGSVSASIDYLSLDDYRQFDVDRDRLHYGSGLATWYSAPHVGTLRHGDHAGLFSGVTVDREQLLEHFPAKVPPRPTHEQVVAWCRNWIDTGKGNGEDKAWPVFTADTRHKGLSRENCFRPAWREAKTKSSQ